MELGGNAPFLVFADADVDDAVAGAAIAKMRNMGEACTAANRFLVDVGGRRVPPAGRDKLAEKLGVMEIGPLIDSVQRDKVDELVRDAVGRGARVLCGGRKVDGPGYYYEPTVLVDVPPTARILREEIFGPVAPVVAFDGEEAAIRRPTTPIRARRLRLHERHQARVPRSERLETGIVGLNQGMVSNAAAPFGGVKQSGFGREGGPRASRSTSRPSTWRWRCSVRACEERIALVRRPSSRWPRAS